MQYVWDRGIYRCVPTTMCKDTTGKNPVGCKWIDTNKGDDIEPQYRSRLVATERRIHKRDSIFAATPPLESLRVLMALLAQKRDPKHKPLKLGLVDVSRAHFYAKSQRN
eukprot:5775356-Karenia_brevis.AAC.1